MSTLPQRVKGQALSKMPAPYGLTPAEQILEALGRLEELAALAAFVKLYLPEHLSPEQPRTLEELEAACGARPAELARLLRVLQPMGLVREKAGTYRLTEQGKILRADAEGSMRPAVLMLDVQEMYPPLWELDKTVILGQAAYEAERRDWYAWFAENPVQRRLFGEYMVARSQQMAPTIAATTWPRSGTLVDVGGGWGTILAEVLTRHAGWRGVLQERPEVLPQAGDYLTKRGVRSRVELVEGDFLTAVPPGGTAYLLASILHNFGDDEAVRILRNVRAALAESGGRVICVDMILPKGDGPHPALTLDLRMMTRTARGRERTYWEYAALLQEGLGVTTRPHVTPLPLGLSMITVDPPPVTADVS